MRASVIAALSITTFFAACTQPPPPSAEQQASVDAAFAQVDAAIDQAGDLAPFIEIDHSRRGVKAGQNMPPARVRLFRAPKIEIPIVAENPRAAVDLPLRVLAYSEPEGDAQIAYNSFDLLRKRHGLEPSEAGSAYDATLAAISKGVDAPGHATALPTEQGDGLIVNDAVGSVAEVAQRLKSAVEAVDGAVYFGEIDYQAEAKKAGLDIAPVTLVLFGNPSMGAPAMADMPELGLDQFCQKVVIWEDDQGVHTAHNDIAWQAERRGGSLSIPRRKVRLGLGSTVKGAAQP